MTTPFLAQPNPDFAELEQVLRGEQQPRRVHLVEHGIDVEVLQAINERYGEQPWIPLTERTRDAYYKQIATLHYRLGYECVVEFPRWVNHPTVKKRSTADTAELSRGERAWVNESHGLISSWEDFERFPWDTIRPDYSFCEILGRNLLPGMKVIVGGEIFEHVLEYLLGYEGLFYLLYDNPELVAQVFARWGARVYQYYEAVIGMPQVGAILHSDDLGFRTSTMLSPQALRELVFPWFKKYAVLAHEHGKMFWLHSCGNLFPDVIEDLIEDVQIDAFHSFQDVILPVVDFKARYGHRVATLGGVDMDKLARMDEVSLRQYIRDILAQCMPGGRFALGSGNTIANYIPLRNYFILLEEGRRWRP